MDKIRLLVRKLPRVQSSEKLKIIEKQEEKKSKHDSKSLIDTVILV